MDLGTCVLLGLEGCFALRLLWRSRLLESKTALWLSVALTAGAFLLRAYCLPYETLDYKDFLKQWVAFYRENLGFKSLSYPLGNYNIPYLYFLAFFSYLPINDLYLIKLLSIFFDVVLAFASMKLLSLCGKGKGTQLACFFTVLFLPTVVLNGSLWGQCDSIYVAFALLGLWLGLTDRPILSMLCFTLSFGFKLQAVFLMPIMAVLWFRGNYKLWHFALFPVFYVLLVLPAVLLGKPFMDTITLYASQTGSIGSGLNYNSPSVYAFFWRRESRHCRRLHLYGRAAAVLLFPPQDAERAGGTGCGAAVRRGDPLLPAAHARALFLRRRRPLGGAGLRLHPVHPCCGSDAVCLAAGLFDRGLCRLFRRESG